jgi:hypothetical protein
MANLEEVFNKVLVEISKANEALYFFKTFWNELVNNSFNLDWVYRDFAIFND